ncbi:MAG: hypothetical protein ACR2QM_03085, partial [Longimicrobiales bacterium]
MMPSRTLTSLADSADIYLELAGPERGIVGATIPYEVRVENLGPSVATHVRYRAMMPEGAAFVEASGGGILDDDGIVRWPAVDRLETGPVLRDTLWIRYDEVGQYRTDAWGESELPDPDLTNNDANEPTLITLPPSADLAVVKVGPTTAQAGDTVEYIITTSNSGPDLADWVYVHDVLAPGAVFVSANRMHTVEDGVVQWEMIHIIDPGEFVQDTVRVILPEPGSYTNTASAEMITDDPNPGNEESSVTTVVPDGPGPSEGVDLALAQVARPDPFEAGGIG